MKVLMQIPVTATMEWRAIGGIYSVTIEDTTEKPATFIVHTSDNDQEPIIGSVADVLREAERLVDDKKLGVTFLSKIAEVADEMIRQPIPSVTFNREDLINERDSVRARRRDWLIREVENGNYAAITMLKDEFGETVRLTVEVV